MNDVLPAEYALKKQSEGQLRRLFESYGYSAIDVPIVEYTDLHLRKSGLDVLSRLYDFTYKNRRLCLRPDMTASVMRAYVNELQGAPLPIRLYYVGPVFRYEKPQRVRYRQFTEMGIELIGSSHSAADAEVISVACAGLDLLGLARFHLVIGHIGILSRFLDTLELDRHLQQFLIYNMGNLRSKGIDYVLERLHEVYPTLVTRGYLDNYWLEVDRELDIFTNPPISDLLNKLTLEESRHLILELVSIANIEIDGKRESNEIIDRLLAKLRSGEQFPRIRRALSFMSELCQLRGEPEAVLQEARQLFAAHNLAQLPLDEIEAVIHTLMLQRPETRLALDLGLTRGLQYYTGVIFEIYYRYSDSEEVKLCGGGRYDDLAGVLGSRKVTPATGFAYGLERLNVALQENVASKRHVPTCLSDVFVVQISSEDSGYAHKVAELFRQSGLNVEADVRDRSVKSNLQYAQKRAIPYVVFVGSMERETSTVTLRDMHSKEELQLSIVNAVKLIDQRKGGVTLQ